MSEDMFAAFYKIAEHVSRGDTVDEALASTVEFATVFLNCDECCTYVRQGDELVPWVWKHVKQGSLQRTPLPVGCGFAAAVKAQRAPIAVSADLTKGARFKVFAEWSRTSGETFVCAPFLSRFELVGAITLRHWRPRRYHRYELQFLSSIGYLLGAELGIARLEQENADLLLELETRKLVEPGQGILEPDLGTSEREAHLAFESQSQQKQPPGKETARAIILEAEVSENVVQTESTTAR